MSFVRILDHIKILRRRLLVALLLMGLAVTHISEAERKEIARGLFQVTRDDSRRSELIGLCPIHGEKNPLFSYSYKKDKYDCFACGASGDLIRLWTEVHGYGHKAGFKAFCEKHGLSGEADRRPSGGAPGHRKGKSEGDKVIPESELEALAPLPGPWTRRLEKQRGWREAVIALMDLRLFVDSKRGEQRIAIPIRDDQGFLVQSGIFAWAIEGLVRLRTRGYFDMSLE